MKLKSKIQNKKVEFIKVYNSKFIVCNGHQVSYVRFQDYYQKAVNFMILFSVNTEDIKIKPNMRGELLFGCECSVQEIINIYNELYGK